MTAAARPIVAVDLFCGVGGLSAGLKQAGVQVAAGVDIDPACQYPFEANLGAKFLLKDVSELTAAELNELWPQDAVRLLAGCAPCQPFSPYRRGVDTSDEAGWPLLNEFARLIRETNPDLVTMENVPRIGKAPVFEDFVQALRDQGYKVDWRSCFGPRYGLPQQRRRLVLVASRLASITVPEGHLTPEKFKTVRSAIGALPRIGSGEADPADPLHVSRNLSELNLKRIAASKPGGTWEDWPKVLRAPCHQKASGSTFKNVYARMSWDEPSPTITTLATNFGAGRFGHPEQHRSISLREAAILQGFPRGYRFVKKGEPIQATAISRLIGNAVPPPLAKAVGNTLLEHVREFDTTK